MESKKPTHYFVSIRYSESSTNKLQAEFREYLLGLDKSLVDADKIEDFKKEIEVKANELNEKGFKLPVNDENFFKIAKERNVDYVEFDLR